MCELPTHPSPDPPIRCFDPKLTIQLTVLEEKQLPPGFSRENDPALLTDHGVRPYVGDMVLDLTPSGTASVGGVG